MEIKSYVAYRSSASLYYDFVHLYGLLGLAELLHTVDFLRLLELLGFSFHCPLKA